VSSHLSRLRAGQIAHLNLVIGARRGDLGAVLGEIDVEDGAGVFVDVAAFALAGAGDFVDADLLVPTRHGEEVRISLRRREGDVGDAVFGRVVEGDVLGEVAEGLARCCSGR